MTADANGNIRDQFNLPDWFVAVYSVTATGATSGTVTTSFTDARLVTSATLNGGSSVSVQPGDSITANVTVQRDGTGINARWNSTGWRVNTTAPGSVTCVNHSNHETNAVPAVTDSESFSITAPNAPGTYNAYFVAYSTDNCRAQGGTNGAPSATFMISNGVVVKSNQATLTYTGPTTGTYGDKLTLSSSGGSGTGAVTYETTGTACELGTGADAGKLLITSGTGTCSVTVNKAADNNYKDATSGPQTITVNKANQTITFNALTDKIVPANFTVSASASSGLPVSFSAGPIGTCTISGTNVSVTGVGACTITASQAGDSNYHPATSVPQSFNASYTFFGWLQPVDGDGTATGLVNMGKVGRTYPIKWQLKDATGALISDAAAQALVSSMSGVAKKANCATFAGSDALEEYTAGATQLRYDATSDQFIYNYKAPSSPVCQAFVVSKADGVNDKQANFNFTK